MNERKKTPQPPKSKLYPQSDEKGEAQAQHDIEQDVMQDDEVESRLRVKRYIETRR